MGYFKNRIKSFGYAFKGLAYMFKNEAHARIHLAATILVIILGFYTILTKMEWIAVIGCIGLVWMAEAFNTAIEKIMDLVSPEKDDRVGVIKDVAAGAVLIAAIAAAIIGLMVFVPKF